MVNWSGFSSVSPMTWKVMVMCLLLTLISAISCAFSFTMYWAFNYFGLVGLVFYPKAMFLLRVFLFMLFLDGLIAVGTYFIFLYRRK